MRDCDRAAERERETAKPGGPERETGEAGRESARERYAAALILLGLISGCNDQRNELDPTALQTGK